MRLSRLSNRQLLRLLKKGEVRFGDEEYSKMNFFKVLRDLDFTIYLVAKILRIAERHKDENPELFKAVEALHKTWQKALQSATKVTAIVSKMKY